MKTQVLIVGAGPVGLTIVMELARYGVSVRIVDKAAQRTDKSKAIVLWSRTLELLDRAGCTGYFVAAGHKVHAANIVTGRQLTAHVDFTGVGGRMMPRICLVLVEMFVRPSASDWWRIG